MSRTGACLVSPATEASARQVEGTTRYAYYMCTTFLTNYVLLCVKGKLISLVRELFLRLNLVTPSPSLTPTFSRSHLMKEFLCEAHSLTQITT